MCMYLEMLTNWLSLHCLLKITTRIMEHLMSCLWSCFTSFWVWKCHPVIREHELRFVIYWSNGAIRQWHCQTDNPTKLSTFLSSREHLQTIPEYPWELCPYCIEQDGGACVSDLSCRRREFIFCHRPVIHVLWTVTTVLPQPQPSVFIVLIIP